VLRGGKAFQEQVGFAHRQTQGDQSMNRKQFSVNVSNILALALLTFLLGGAIFVQPAHAQNYTVVHPFTGDPDGIYPSPIIRDAQGNLYGTTYAGGNTACSGHSGACGTVFKIDSAGNETQIFTFPGGALGSNPIATVAEDAAGNLYGTTEGDGFLGASVIYKIDPSGQETVLAPNAQTGGSMDSPLLVGRDGNLYGMTPYGGNYTCGYDDEGCGQLFRLTQSGTYTMLHAFNGTDGIRPDGGLVQDSKGNLYGVAFYGGNSQCETTGIQYPYDPPDYETKGCGTIFELDVKGKFTVLHTFAGPGDGGGPLGLIIDSANNLYGIAQNGGIYEGNGQLYGSGTIFKVDTTNGDFSVLFSFTPPISNSNGFASHLVRDSKGNLYGAKQFDGAHNTGFLFRIDTEENLTDLFDFAELIGLGTPEGYYPVGLALGSAHDIYGSMFMAGFDQLCCGTIFHITP
jgi:uncharacterized repeat protein (TIGR03803 family)